MFGECGKNQFDVGQYTNLERSVERAAKQQVLALRQFQRAHSSRSNGLRSAATSELVGLAQSGCASEAAGLKRDATSTNRRGQP